MIVTALSVVYRQRAYACAAFLLFPLLLVFYAWAGQVVVVDAEGVSVLLEPNTLKAARERIERALEVASMIPQVTVGQMREVDRMMVEDLGITLLQMMENAGRALASQARHLLGGSVLGRRIVMLAGRGGNGGGGLAAARRLSIWGAEVVVILGHAATALEGAAAHQLSILNAIGVSVEDPVGHGYDPGVLPPTELIIDALIGYRLRGAPREPIATLIRAANTAGVPVLALDIPSGLDGDSGIAADPTIQATATLTLALPKTGLMQPAARRCVGELFVADISVPAMVYQRLGLHVGPVFARSDIVRVAGAEHG